MGWGTFEFNEFKNYAKNMQEQLKKQTAESFLRDLMNEIGTIIIANVKENTPVGDYSPRLVSFVTQDGKQVEFMASYHGKTGGNLRDSWKVGDVTILGGTVALEIINTAYYAEWVEKGHRTVNGGWVEGQFMLETTLKELEEKLPEIIEPKYVEYLERILGG